jgi:hypothetical protein
MCRDIDRIVEGVRHLVPDVVVTQLQVRFPADDGGIWWFAYENGCDDIQIESSTGMCPFLVETNEASGAQARRAYTVDEALHMLVEWLTNADRSTNSGAEATSE